MRKTGQRVFPAQACVLRRFGVDDERRRRSGLALPSSESGTDTVEVLIARGQEGQVGPGPKGAPATWAPPSASAL